MKEYRFQYTEQKDLIYLGLACITSFLLVLFIGLKFPHESKQIAALITALPFLAMFIVFQSFKKNVVSNCVAKMNKNSIEFELKNGVSSAIIFNELRSYKIYYSIKGTALNLKTHTSRLRIITNYHYCNIDSFNKFCKDLEIQIENYKSENNVNIIHEGSIFHRKKREVY